MGAYDDALAKALGGQGFDELNGVMRGQHFDMGLEKAHVKAHFRRDPKTGKLSHIADYDDSRHKHELAAEFHKGTKVKITSGKHAGKEGKVTSYSGAKYHEVSVVTDSGERLLMKPENLENAGGPKAEFGKDGLKVAFKPGKAEKPADKPADKPAEKSGGRGESTKSEVIKDSGKVRDEDGGWTQNKTVKVGGTTFEVEVGVEDPDYAPFMYRKIKWGSGEKERTYTQSYTDGNEVDDTGGHSDDELTGSNGKAIHDVAKEPGHKAFERIMGFSPDKVAPLPGKPKGGGTKRSEHYPGIRTKASEKPEAKPAGKGIIERLHGPEAAEQRKKEARAREVGRKKAMAAGLDWTKDPKLHEPKRKGPRG